MHAGVAMIELLQTRTLLSGTGLIVDVTDGTMFVRDGSGSDDNDITIRVFEDRIQVTDPLATVTAVTGVQIDANTVEVPLDEVSTRRIATYGNAGNDILNVETRDDVSLAFSFSGGEGTDSWNVDGTTQGDQFQVFSEPVPGAAVTTFSQRTVETGLEESWDLAVDDKNDLVFISGGYTDSQIAVFDFEGERVGTIENVSGPTGMSIYGDTLYVAATNSATVDAFDLRTLTRIHQYSIAPDTTPIGLAAAGGDLFVTVKLGGGRDSQLGRIDLETGEYESAVFGTRRLTNPILSSGSEDSNFFYMGAAAVSPAYVGRVEVGEDSVTSIPGGGGVGSSLKDIAASADGKRVFTAAGSPYGINEIDSETLQETFYPTGAYPRSAATSDADGGYVVGGISGSYSHDIFLFQQGIPEVLLSAEAGRSTGHITQVGIDKEATRIFGATENSRFHVLTLPQRAVALDGQTSLGVGPGIESLSIRTEDGDDRVFANRFDATGLSFSAETGNGNDLVLGTQNGDSLAGGPGNDSLIGGGGNDSLLGNAGDDALRGSAGRDTLDGGLGLDRLYGQSGNDVLVYSADDDEFDRYDGGTSPFDRIQVTGDSATIDFTTLAPERIRGAEIVDLLGDGVQSVVLSESAVAALGVSTLTVTRSMNDSVDIGSGWESSGDLVTAAGHVFSRHASRDLEIRIERDELPGVSILSLSRDILNAPPEAVVFQFSEAVSNFDVGDLTLHHDRSPVAIEGAGTLHQIGPLRFEFRPDSINTAGVGEYVLRLNSEGAGIRDLAGNLWSGTAETS